MLLLRRGRQTIPAGKLRAMTPTDDKAPAVKPCGTLIAVQAFMFIILSAVGT